MKKLMIMPMIKIETLIDIALEAGVLVNQIYEGKTLKVSHKEDLSPLTCADLASHNHICAALQKHYPSLPILSEESSAEFDYAHRKHWDSFFLVDPLDGTKEFLQGNGEFTINIALIENGKPLMGVIHAPACQSTYYAEQGCGAYKIDKNQVQMLPLLKNNSGFVRIGVSRSHLCEETKQFIARLRDLNMRTEEVPLGSALKFGHIAEGTLDLYPRFSPTMEWDTAAGQVIVTEARKMLFVNHTEMPLTYNKPSLINPGFLCVNEELRSKVVGITRG